MFRAFVRSIPETLCAASLIGVPGAVCVYWLTRRAEELQADWLPGGTVLGGLTWPQRAAGIACSLPALVAAVAALRRVWHALHLLNAGSAPLSASLGRCVLGLGRSLRWLALAVVVGKTLTILALTIFNPPGQRVLALDIGGTEVTCLLLGALLCRAAPSLQRAHAWRAELNEFV